MEKKFKDEHFYKSALDSYTNLLIRYNDLLSEKVRSYDEQEELRKLDTFLRWGLKKKLEERLKGIGYDVDEFIKELDKDATHKARLFYYKRLIPSELTPEQTAPYLNLYKIKSFSELEKKSLRELGELYQRKKEFEKEKEKANIKEKEIKAIVENPTDANLLYYAFGKTYERIGRALRETPFLGLTLALPFGGITDALLEYSDLKDIVKHVKAGRLTKEDLKDYLEGKISLREITEKISGWEDYVRKVQKEGTTYPEFIKESIVLEAVRSPFNIKRLLKLGSEIVGYGILGKAASVNNLSKILTGKTTGEIFKELGERMMRPETALLKQIEQEAAKTAIETSMMEVLKAAPLTTKPIEYTKLPKVKPLTELEKTYIEELAKGKTLSEKITAIYRDAQRKQIRETIIADRLLNKVSKKAVEEINKKLKVKKAKDVPEILVVDKQLDILQKYTDFVDERIKNLLKGGIEIEGVVNVKKEVLDKLEAYESIKRAIISVKTSLEEKFLRELSGFKTLEDLAKLQVISTKAIGKTPADLIGKQKAIEAMRDVGMVLELPADSPLIRNFYKVYNPYNIEHMKKIKLKMVEEIRVKDIAAENIGIVDENIAPIWNLLPEKIRRKLLKASQSDILLKEQLYWFISPYNFKRDPIANRIINLDIYMTSKASAETQKLIEAKNALFNKLGIKKDSELDYLLHKLLNTYETWDDVLKKSPEIANKYPQLEEAFKFIRNTTNMLATAQNTLNSAYLGPGQRLAAYMRINYFNPSNLERMRLRLEDLRAKKLIKGLTEEEKKEFSILLNLMKGYEENKDIIKLAPWLQVSVSMPHLKKRTLEDFGWRFSASEMFDDMVINAHKVIYEQPVLQAYFNLRDKIKDPIARSYLHWYLRHSFGYKPVDNIQKITSSITLLEYLLTIGWNVRTALGNAAQIALSAIDLGPGGADYMAKAIGHTVNKDTVFKRALEKFPYYHQIMTMKETLKAEGRLFNRVSDSAFYLMAKTETVNRWLSYFNAYLYALDKGAKISEVNKLLKLGYTLEEAAVKYAAEVMKRTQYVYGKGMPKIWHESWLKPLLPYFSYPLKTTELFADWALNNPGKLFSYLLIANEFYETTNQLGIDLANFFTLGIEPNYLYRSIVNLGVDNEKALKFLKLSGMPLFSGGGVIQFDIPAIGIMRNLLSAMYDFIDKQPLIAYDKSKLIGVLANFSTPLRRIYRGVRALEYGPEFVVKPKAYMDIKEVLLTGKDIKTAYKEEPEVSLVIFDEKDNVKYFSSFVDTLNYMIGFYPVEQRWLKEKDVLVKELKKDYNSYANDAIGFYKELFIEARKLEKKGYSAEEIQNNPKIRELMGHMLNNYRLALTYMPDKRELIALRTKFKEAGRKVVGSRYVKDAIRNTFDIMTKIHKLTDESLINSIKEFIEYVKEE